jgi:hypothetical protein
MARNVYRARIAAAKAPPPRYTLGQLAAQLEAVLPKPITEELDDAIRFRNRLVHRSFLEPERRLPPEFVNEARERFLPFRQIG